MRKVITWHIDVEIRSSSLADHHTLCYKAPEPGPAVSSAAISKEEGFGHALTLVCHVWIAVTN